MNPLKSVAHGAPLDMPNILVSIAASEDKGTVLVRWQQIPSALKDLCLFGHNLENV